MRLMSIQNPVTGKPSTGLSCAWRHLRWMLGLLPGLLLPLAHGQDASRVEVQAERNGALIDVRAQAIVHAPLSIVWATLTDYERLPEFIPGLETSRVLARDGPRATGGG